MTAQRQQPNVVIFFTDQQRWDCSSLHGNPLDLMPNFDRVAQRGTHLFNHVSCAPVCGPARCCLQTGTHITTNGGVANGCGVPDNLPQLAGCFNDAGYRTGYVGKWHLAGKHHNRKQGSGGGAVFAEGRAGWQDWLAVEALEFSVHEYQTILYDNDNQAVRLPGYRVDAVADRGIDFINRNRDRPFCLMMSFIEPHHQNDKDDYPPPDGYRERYEARWTPPDLAALPSQNAVEAATIGGSAQRHLGGYYGMVKRLDEAFGRVLDALKSLDLDEDTIVLFTSDHGSHFKTRNAEYKRSCHESSVRVPTALTGGPFTRGGRVEHVTSLVDLPATLLDACGIDVPDPMEGRSVLPLLGGGHAADWPSARLIHVCDGNAGRAVRTRRWKYCVMSEQKSREIGTDFANATYREAFLYDLKHDPYELHNLIDRGAHTPVREALRAKMLELMDEIGEPRPTIERVEPQPSGQARVRDEEIDA